MLMILRIVVLVLVAWFLWRLIGTLLASRRPSGPPQQDEWADVLEKINNLPETTHTAIPSPLPRQMRPGQDDPTDHARPKDVERMMVQKAEAALALLKKAGKAERLVAYQEIMTYEKLCNTSNISAETWKKIDGIRRQAAVLIDSAEQ